MSHKIGSFCLVLHGHLPYVLHHGTWPHGEDWLYEAAAETYLPLLSTIDECVFFNANPKVCMGLTPVLLEQLAHDHFKKGFEDYLKDRIERAKQDRREFANWDNGGHLQHLAWRWEEWYGKIKKTLLEMQGTDGSWEKRGGDAESPGPIYQTSIAVIVLSVPAHYLPIYQR